MNKEQHYKELGKGIIKTVSNNIKNREVTRITTNCMGVRWIRHDSFEDFKEYIQVRCEGGAALFWNAVVQIAVEFANAETQYFHSVLNVWEEVHGELKVGKVDNEVPDSNSCAETMINLEEKENTEEIDLADLVF